MISIRDICKAKAVGDRVLLNELSLKRVLELQDQSSKQTWAMVTTDTLDATNEDRASRRSALDQRVRSLGYGTSSLDGIWTRNPTDSAGNNLDSRFVQSVVFIHGITLKHLQRLMVRLGPEKALFGYPDSNMALMEPSGANRIVGAVSPAAITHVWGANRCSGWRFEGFMLLPHGFVENMIEQNLRRNIENLGLDAVLRDRDLQPSAP